ncbi:DUF881 domain-containing protein [Falsibacillus pallidus]|uniref:Uncharacterized protein YlxW (UPF0749 family) n=1 Tax=Falsibacillus pallidus TaxID=493781 RepID=A0A370GW99_9BACI|nr:DUF881 domain-containing protein [Falsibacillus pallidus]RDI47546.1 uncharacterized protein YlxW (UPF0749 family) [Falsibacillus pallidus]
MKKKKIKGKQVVLSLVTLVLGFILAFSYSLANKEKAGNKISDRQWAMEDQLRNQIIQQQKDNRKLQNELFEKQSKVLDVEKDLSKEEQVFFNLAEDAEKYRMYLGMVKVKGKGVEVTLEDGEYDPDEENVNNYLVHEHHVFNVINELYIAGASAVAVNGQRLQHNSYILCNGPVITVDGVQHPAPFTISAIGDPAVLSSALSITGGVKDQLVNENIIFKMEKKDEIVMDPILRGS